MAADDEDHPFCELDLEPIICGGANNPVAQQRDYELSLARGGPRCLTMPLLRDALAG